MPHPISPELSDVMVDLQVNPVSRHDALLRDLMLLVEDVGNLAADQGWNHIEYRCDGLYVRLRGDVQPPCDTEA